MVTVTRDLQCSYIHTYIPYVFIQVSPARTIGPRQTDSSLALHIDKRFFIASLILIGSLNWPVLSICLKVAFDRERVVVVSFDFIGYCCRSAEVFDLPPVPSRQTIPFHPCGVYIRNFRLNFFDTTTAPHNHIHFVANMSFDA